MSAQSPFFQAVCDNDLNKVRQIVYENDDIELNSQTYKGMTALMIAILMNYRKIIRFLVTVCADETIKDKDGWMTIHYASSKNEEAIKTLIYHAKRKRAEIIQCFLILPLEKIVASYLNHN